MWRVLRNRTYRHLFFAQVVALVGTGLATVALGFLAYELAEERAGEVLGTALAIKMVAYVVISPLAAAFAERVSRKTMLLAFDGARALVASFLPFVDAVWQVYVLIFVLQAASASFTPAFQATIPDVLPEDEDYTNALTLSRLAYDLESVASPVLAASLLALVSFRTLFLGTVVGFVASMALIVAIVLPKRPAAERRGIYDRTTRGIRLFFARPTLLGLLSLNLAVSAAGSMVIVNTVVLVQAELDLGSSETAFALAAYGAGSMLAAFAVPRLVAAMSPRRLMMWGGVLLAPCLAVGGVVRGVASAGPTYALVLALWSVLGVGCSLVQTPSGRILRDAAPQQDRPAVFAAQFALSHVCWLLTYPLVGWLGSRAGLAVAFLAMSVLAAIGIAGAHLAWSSRGDDAASASR